MAGIPNTRTRNKADKTPDPVLIAELTAKAEKLKLKRLRSLQKSPLTLEQQAQTKLASFHKNPQNLLLHFNDFKALTIELWLEKLIHQPANVNFTTEEKDLIEKAMRDWVDNTSGFTARSKSDVEIARNYASGPSEPWFGTKYAVDSAAQPAATKKEISTASFREHSSTLKRNILTYATDESKEALFNIRNSEDINDAAAVPGTESPLAAPRILGAPTSTLPQVDSGNLASTANSGAFGPGAPDDAGLHNQARSLVDLPEHLAQNTDIQNVIFYSYLLEILKSTEGKVHGGLFAGTSVPGFGDKKFPAHAAAMLKDIQSGNFANRPQELCRKYSRFFQNPKEPTWPVKRDPKVVIAYKKINLLVTSFLAAQNAVVASQESNAVLAIPVTEATDQQPLSPAVSDQAIAASAEGPAGHAPPVEEERSRQDEDSESSDRLSTIEENASESGPASPPSRAGSPISLGSNNELRDSPGHAIRLLEARRPAAAATATAFAPGSRASHSGSSTDSDSDSDIQMTRVATEAPPERKQRPISLPQSLTDMLKPCKDDTQEYPLYI